MNNSVPHQPRRFGAYDLQGLIGDGSTANVYRALAADGTKVALKVLDQQRLGATSIPATTFLREAELLARLENPNVIGLVDHGVCEGHPYVAMDYFDGTTLERLFATSPPSPDRLFAILIRVCRGLAEAHRQGLLHRDVKPSNILVDDRDAVKIVDFGLAKEFGDGVSMTGDGVLLGTPAYMAPEQIRGRPLDGRCDIYAIGAVLYTGLAGRPPFLQRQTAALLMAHLNDDVPPLAQVAPEGVWPQTVERVVARCLEKNRTDRFDTMEQLITALEACRDALSNPTDDAKLLATMPAPRGVPLRPLTRPSYLPAALGLLFACGFFYVIGQGYVALSAPLTDIPVVPVDRDAMPPTPPISTVATEPLSPLVSVEEPPGETPRTRPAKRQRSPETPAVSSPRAAPPRARPKRRTDLKNPFSSLETP